MAKTAIVYPDGSGHALKRFCTNGVKGLKVIESARIKVGKDTVIIHANQVSFDGARLTVVLDSMARELVRLAQRIRHFEHQEAQIKAKKKAGT